MSNQETPQKKEKKSYPNSGALFRANSNRPRPDGKPGPDYSGQGEITVIKDIPAGTIIEFFIDGYVKKFTNSRTGQAGALLSLRFKAKGVKKEAAPVAAGFGKPAQAPQQQAQPQQQPPTQTNESPDDSPGFDF